jgi:hypothetical protein
LDCDRVEFNVELVMRVRSSFQVAGGIRPDQRLALGFNGLCLLFGGRTMRRVRSSVVMKNRYEFQVFLSRCWFHLSGQPAAYREQNWRSRLSM